ncbi:hypothetical protein BDZ89DRAFT_1065224 [Hymenopellis radicata]|nr:hypothetical protein BDZ89DRAFT_1065224 [Hymenopellis radicata]
MSIVDSKVDFRYIPNYVWDVYIRQPSEIPFPPPYKTKPKTKVAKSAISSVRYNVRNLESPCHALYGTIFHDLTEPYDNIFPHIQYTLDLRAQPDGKFTGRPGRGHNLGAHFDALYLSGRLHQASSVVQNEVQDEDSVMSDEDEEVKADPLQAAEAKGEGKGGPDHNNGDDPIQPEGDVELVANTSAGSTVTVVGPRVDLIPDLAPSYQSTERIRFSRRAGVQLNHLCPAIVGEFKRMPSRQLLPTDSTWNDLMLKSTDYFQNAYSDLFVYVAYVFAGHPYMTRVVAVAGVGIYWTYGVFIPDDVPKVDVDTGEMVEGLKGYMDVYLTFAKRFYAYHEVGTPESDQSFTRIRNLYLHPLACDNFDETIDRVHAEKLRLENEKYEREKNGAGVEFIHL